MITLREVVSPGSPITLADVLRLLRTNSLKTAARQLRLNGVKDALAFGVFDEEKARALLLGSGSAGTMLYVLRRVTWATLDDFLNETVIDEFAKRLQRLLDRRSVVLDILEGIFGDPTRLHTVPMDDLRARFRGHFGRLTLNGRRGFADRLLARRGAILDSVFITQMRGLEPHQLELCMVIEETAALGGHRPDELARLSWEVRYLALIAHQLESGEGGALLNRLPDLVDPDLPHGQRTALFDMLRRADPVIDAMKLVIDTLGSTRQQNDMRAFRERVHLFLAPFPQGPPASPTPEDVEALANALGVVTDQLDELRRAVQDAASELASLTLPDLLGTEDDDRAVDVIGKLHSQGRLAPIPAAMKSTMINSLTDGSTGDDDETAILRVLKQTLRARPEAGRQSKAEFLQLIVAARFEMLDESLDGAEHDEFMALLESL